MLRSLVPAARSLHRRARSSHAALESSSSFSQGAYSDANMDAAVATYVYPGSRVLELADLRAGNVLTLDSLASISKKLRIFSSNPSVAAVMFSARIDPSKADENTFSSGLDFTADKPNLDVLLAAQGLAKEVSSLRPISLAVYEGLCTGSPFGVFAGSRLRLGTSDTVLHITELAQGVLPIGGLAYHMARGCKDGVAMARYLAVAQRPVECVELYSLGLVSHIVPPECHTTLLTALGNTLSDDDMQKRVQGKGVCRGSLLHLLDTMHAGSDLEMDFGDPDAWNDFDFNAKDDTWDVRPLDNPMWDQALLVPPSMLEADVEEFDPRDLHEIRAKVARCFGAEDLQSCVRRLREYEGEQWADEARNGLLRLDPFLAEAWFALTRLSASDAVTHAQCLDMETLAATRLSDPAYVRTAAADLFAAAQP